MGQSCRSEDARVGLLRLELRGGEGAPPLQKVFVILPFPFGSARVVCSFPLCGRSLRGGSLFLLAVDSSTLESSLRRLDPGAQLERPEKSRIQ